MSRRVEVILQEILEAIDGIEQSLTGKTFDEFRGDWLLRHGTQRGIEIISEAARHLPDDFLSSNPHIPWRKIRGVGNVLRHEYHRISDQIILTVVENELPPLREAVQKGLR